MNFWKEFFFNNAVGIILSTAKSPDDQMRYKRAFLKIRNTINAAFASDPDFQ